MSDWPHQDATRTARDSARPVDTTDPVPDTPDLLATTFTEYGINPMHTPEKVTLEWTRAGIIVDQFVQLSDTLGDVLMHEGEHGRAVDTVTVRRFFPHPMTNPTE